MLARLAALAALLLLLTAAPAVAAPAPKLGVKGLFGTYGKGWGAVKPSMFYNGGVPSGLVRKVKWTGWGRDVARGKAWGSQYRPGGGYYRKSVRVEIRAMRLGTCRGKRAYTRMLVRMQTRPGGSYGEWFPWALDLCDPEPDLASCEDVGFAENSDNVASEIKAFDTDCATAESIARASEHVAAYSSNDGFDQYRFAHGGFLCNGYAFEGEGLYTINWTCLRETAQVSFKRT